MNLVAKNVLLLLIMVSPSVLPKPTIFHYYLDNFLLVNYILLYIKRIQPAS